MRCKVRKKKRKSPRQEHLEMSENLWAASIWLICTGWADNPLLQRGSTGKSFYFNSWRILLILDSESHLDLIPMTKSSSGPLQYDYDLAKSIKLTGGHGEEIVRDLFTDVHVSHSPHPRLHMLKHVRLAPRTLAARTAMFAPGSWLTRRAWTSMTRLTRRKRGKRRRRRRGIRKKKRKRDSSHTKTFNDVQIHPLDSLKRQVFASIPYSPWKPLSCQNYF
jgi:hypothetical protein